MSIEKTPKPVIQKAGDPWTDEQGITIPFTRINQSEKLKERFAGTITNKAMALSKQMEELHILIRKAETDIAQQAAKEGKAVTKKGSFTWYNFDKSVRIEVNNNDTVKFDEAMIAAAREKMDKFLSESVSNTEDIVKQLINSAWHSRKGGLDSKKVLGLTKFRNKIAHKDFQEALNLIEQSQNIDSSKKYYKVAVKDDQGQYKNINLQFSNV